MAVIGEQVALLIQLLRQQMSTAKLFQVSLKAPPIEGARKVALSTMMAAAIAAVLPALLAARSLRFASWLQLGSLQSKKKNSTPQATQATQARAGSAAVQPGAASATLAHNPVYSPPAAAVAAASGGLYETIDDDSVASSMAPAGQAEGYELQAVPGTASAQRSNPATMPSHEHYSGYTVAAPKTPIVYAVPVGDDGVACASKSLPSHDNYSGYTVAAQKPPIVYAGPVADEVRTTAQSVYEVAELVPAEHYVYAETAVAEYAVIPAVPDDPDLSGYC